MASLAQRDDVVACHFCDFRDAETLNVYNFILNVVRMLAASERMDGFEVALLAACECNSLQDVAARVT